MRLGRFHHIDSFALKPILGTKYKRVVQIPGEEFYYVSSDGLYHAPPDGMRTDGGSIPYVFQHIPGLDRDVLLPAYLIHDCDAWYGFVLKRRPGLPDDKVECCLHRAIFTRDDMLRRLVLQECFDLVKIQRRQNDWYLDEAIQTFLVLINRGGMAIRRMLINVGLAIGGLPTWIKYRWKNDRYVRALTTDQ